MCTHSFKISVRLDWAVYILHAANQNILCSHPVKKNVNRRRWLGDNVRKWIHFVAILISFCRKNEACHRDATWLIRDRRPLVEMISSSPAKFISVLKWVHQGWQEKQTDRLTPPYWWFQSKVAVSVCVSGQSSHRDKRMMLTGAVWPTFPPFCC